ncbi:MAG: hypothetical protein ACRD6X_05475 [Pyrinomonadaceae bacterium]
MFDWNKFQLLAEELRNKDDEASQRTSISRLYYAVYWKARNHLVNNGYQYDRNKSSHKQIWDEYMADMENENKIIGKKGKELHRYRIQADYYDSIDKLINVVEDSFAVAEDVSDRLSKA